MRAEPRPVRIVALCSALMFFYGFFLGGLQSVISEVAAHFHADASGMGMLVSAQYLSAAVAPMLMGALADRVGKRPVIAAFSLIFGLGCLLAGTSRAVGVYIAGALLIGAGYSVCETICCAALTDLDPARSARWITLTQGLLCVGAVLSPLIVRALIARLGASWRAVFYICAAAFLLLAPPLAATRFPQPPSRAGGDAPSGRASGGLGLGALFSSGVFACLFVSILLYVGLENGFGYFAESLFAQRLGAGELGAIAISLYWAGMAASRLLFSLRSFDSRRLLVRCFAASAVLFALLAALKLPRAALALSLLVGAAFGPVWSTLIAEAARRFPERSGSASGAMSAGCALGGILYPTLMGLTAKHLSLPAAFALLALTAAAGAALCVRLPRGAEVRQH